jgi:Glycosyl hydrolase family 81 C-terminal domain
MIAAADVGSFPLTLQAPLDDLLREFANPGENDRYFPFARHMDWFDGHSWASGYTVFAAGKNQVGSASCIPERCCRLMPVMGCMFAKAKPRYNSPT